MPLTKNEITELALRYIAREEITDFPMQGDLLCFLERAIPENAVLKDSEGWHFGGYGICKEYEYDDESKPVGKWIWFNFISLSTFPPTKQVLKLQPPHVVKGLFQDTSRTNEIKIIKVPNYFLEDVPVETTPDKQTGLENEENNPDKKIVPFPRRK